MKKQSAKLNRLLGIGLIVMTMATFPGIVGKAQGQEVLTLEAAVQKGIKNNTLIKEMIAKEKAAVAGEMSTRADLFPKLNTTYTFFHLKDRPYAYSGPYKFDVSKRDNISWDFTITQPLFTGFALITRQKIASLGIDLQEIQREQAVLDIAKQVKISYFQILLARRALEVAEEEVKQLENHVDDARHLYNEGVIPYNDYLKSEVALAQSRQGRVKAESDLKITISALNTLIRRNILDNTIIKELPPFQPRPYNISRLFEDAIQNRPELKALRVALRQADLGIRLARSQYYPKVYLMGRYEREGDNLLASNNDFANQHNASIGIQISWPLFESGKKHAEVTRAIYHEQVLAERIKGIKDSILLEVRNAYQGLKVAEKNIQTAQKALAQAKENFRITNLQYQQQTTTSTEVLDARTFLTQAEVNYHNALYGYRIAEAELMRAIGRM